MNIKTMLVAVLLTFNFVYPAFAKDDGVGGAEFAAAIGIQAYGRCHQDTCGLFIIDQAAPLGTGKDGMLYVISGRGWEAIYRQHGVNDTHEYDRPPISTTKPSALMQMVYCSKSRPITFYYYENAWQWAPLRPGDQDAIFGAIESALQLYLAACHRFIVRDLYESRVQATIKRLGYHFSENDSWGKDGDAGSGIHPLDMLK
jgi:hypothetical protein